MKEWNYLPNQVCACVCDNLSGSCIYLKKQTVSYSSVKKEKV
jgi:hypothetical protein